MLLGDKPKKELTHKGLRQDRLTEHGPEKIIAVLWEENNKRQLGTNHGYTSLEHILNTISLDGGGAPYDNHSFIAPTQRDTDVAATVIQWLGTGAGKSFLVRVEQKIKEFKKEQLYEFDEKYNKTRT